MTGVLDLDQLTATTPETATGYVQVGLAPLEPAPAEGAGWSFGAGQIMATATDLARWDMGLLGKRLLPASFVREETIAPVLAGGNRNRRLSIVWEELANGQTDDFLIQPVAS